LIASITNPNNDNITEYGFWDGGSGNGHFAVNGAPQPDEQWIVVNANDLSNVQYVGGAVSGNETLYVTVYDNTTGAWSNYASLTATTTGLSTISSTTIQDEYLAITRTALPLDQATAIADAINVGTQSESGFVNSLFSQVLNTTVPAVAVEGSMYGAVGTSAEITSLVTQFLPAQVANAEQYGLNPQVYASEALGLAFAFGNENQSTAFENNFGPSNSAMPDSAAGDAAFAAAGASTIFGSASTANLINALDGYVVNWKAFYTSHGVPGVANATPDQIDLAARGAAWGDAVGVELANNLGALYGQVINFLDDAAQGSALYSTSLIGQPAHQQFT
jgi:hypothetical protein